MEKIERVQFLGFFANSEPGFHVTLVAGLCLSKILLLLGTTCYYGVYLIVDQSTLELVVITNKILV